jgi:hypothetical protein
VRAAPQDCLTASLDAALDQVTHGKAHVGFESVDSLGVQPIPKARNVRRSFHDHADYGRAIERALVGRAYFLKTWLGRAQPTGVRLVGCAYVEVRALPIVAHEESAAIGEPAI